MKFTTTFILGLLLAAHAFAQKPIHQLMEGLIFTAAYTYTGDLNADIHTHLEKYTRLPKKLDTGLIYVFHQDGAKEFTPNEVKARAKKLGMKVVKESPIVYPTIGEALWYIWLSLPKQGGIVIGKTTEAGGKFGRDIYLYFPHGG